MKSISSILILTVLLTVKLVSSKISNEIPSYQRSYAASKVHQPRTVRDLQQFRVGEPVYTTIEEVQQRAAAADYSIGEASPRFCGSKKEPVHVQPVYIPVPHQEPHPVPQYHQVTYSVPEYHQVTYAVPEYHHVSYPVQQVQHVQQVQQVSYPVQQYHAVQQYYPSKQHCGKSADSVFDIDQNRPQGFQPSEMSSAAYDMTLFNSESNRNAQYQANSYQRAAMAHEINDAQHQVDAKAAQMQQMNAPLADARSAQMHQMNAPLADARSAQMYQMNAPQADARSAQMYQMNAPQADARSAQMYQMNAPQADARSAQMYQMNPQQADARSAQMHQMNAPGFSQMRSAAAPEMKSAFAYDMNRNAANQADQRSAQMLQMNAPSGDLSRHAMYQADERSAQVAMQYGPSSWPQPDGRAANAPMAPEMNRNAATPFSGMFRSAAAAPMMNRNVMPQAEGPRTFAYAGSNPFAWSQITRNAASQQAEAPRAAYAESPALAPMFRAAAYPPQMNSNIMYQADLPRAAFNQYQINDGRISGYFMPGPGRSVEHQPEGKSALIEKSAAKAADVMPAPVDQESPAVPEISTPSVSQPSGKTVSDIQTDEDES